MRDSMLMSVYFLLLCALAVLAKCYMLLSWASSVPYVCVRSLFDSTSVESKLGMAVVGILGTAETQHRL